MQKYIIIILIVLNCGYIFSKEPQPNYRNNTSNVKTLISYSYNVSIQAGKIKKELKTKTEYYYSKDQLMHSWRKYNYANGVCSIYSNFNVSNHKPIEYKGYTSKSSNESAKLIFRYEFQYDEAGNKILLKRYGWQNNIIEKRIYQYNEKNDLITEKEYDKNGTLKNEYGFKNEYNSNGQMIKKKRFKKDEKKFDQIINYKYDQDDNLIGEFHKHPNPDNYFQSIYNYDKEGYFNKYSGISSASDQEYILKDLIHFNDLGLEVITRRYKKKRGKNDQDWELYEMEEFEIMSYWE